MCIRGELHGGTNSERYWAAVIGVVPLNHVVVLNPDDRKSVKVAGAHQPLDIGDVLRGDERRELDHDTSAGQLEVQSVIGIRHAPVRGG